MRALLLLLLLGGCTLGPTCEPDGIPIHYYAIETCFWPEEPAR